MRARWQNPMIRPARTASLAAGLLAVLLAESAAAPNYRLDRTPLAHLTGRWSGKRLIGGREAVFDLQVRWELGGRVVLLEFDFAAQDSTLDEILIIAADSSRVVGHRFIASTDPAGKMLGAGSWAGDSLSFRFPEEPGSPGTRIVLRWWPESPQWTLSADEVDAHGRTRTRFRDLIRRSGPTDVHGLVPTR